MLSKFKFKIQNEIIALFALIIITTILTLYYNYTKKKVNEDYKQIIENVYFKKTITHFFNKLEPRFKKVTHNVKNGETFDSILENYFIEKEEVKILKNKLSKKVNLNKLRTNQKIYLTIDQSKNTIKEFIFQISNKERIVLTQDLENKIFNQK